MIVATNPILFDISVCMILIYELLPVCFPVCFSVKGFNERVNGLYRPGNLVLFQSFG